MVQPLSTQDAHQQAMRASVPEIAGLLSQLLSRRVTAYIAGVDDAKTVSRWMTGKTVRIRNLDVERRLRTAYEIAVMLLSTDSSDVVRAWFISLNPQLGDVTPVEAIHNGEVREALSAARSFVVGG
jgi:hypothetical protein